MGIAYRYFHPNAQVMSLIVVGVAGTTLSQISSITPTPSPSPPDIDFPPSIGKPAAIFAIVTACLCIFMSYAIAVVRILQMKISGINFTNSVVIMILSYSVS